MNPDRVKSIREKLKLSQERFAALLCTTYVTVNRWENGKSKPSLVFVKHMEALEAKDGMPNC